MQPIQSQREPDHADPFIKTQCNRTEKGKEIGVSNQNTRREATFCVRRKSQREIWLATGCVTRPSCSSNALFVTFMTCMREPAAAIGIYNTAAQYHGYAFLVAIYDGASGYLKGIFVGPVCVTTGHYASLCNTSPGLIWWEALLLLG